jgi:hypothetical protein
VAQSEQNTEQIKKTEICSYLTAGEWIQLIQLIQLILLLPDNESAI